MRISGIGFGWLLTLAFVLLGAGTFFEGTALTKTVALGSAFFGTALEVGGLGIHCHGVEV
jgi:hypothetical protein